MKKDVGQNSLYPTVLNSKSHNIQPNTPQPQAHNDNNSSLLIARESSILKYNRLVCLIIRANYWVGPLTVPKLRNGTLRLLSGTQNILKDITFVRS